LRVANESSGDSNSLLLASRESDSSLANNSVKAFREDLFIHDEIVTVSILASLLEHLVDGLLCLSFQVDSIEDVVLDRVREKNRLLLHYSNLSLMVPGVVDVLQVNSIVLEFTLKRVIPALNKRDDRGLATTRGSDKGNYVVLRDLERDIMEDRDFRLSGVGEGDLLNFYLGVRASYDVSGGFLTDGVNVARSVDDVGDSNARSLDFGEISNVVEHSTDVHGKSLHIHEVSEHFSNTDLLVRVL